MKKIDIMFFYKMKNYPLVKNNITKVDLNKVIQYLKQNDPILTQSKNVESFEKNWSNWLE